VTAVFLALPAAARACPACRGAVYALVAEDFWGPLGAALAPFAGIAVALGPLARWVSRGR